MPFEYQVSTGDAKSWFDAVRTCKVIDTIGTFNRLEVHVLRLSSIKPQGAFYLFHARLRWRTYLMKQNKALHCF